MVRKSSWLVLLVVLLLSAVLQPGMASADPGNWVTFSGTFVDSLGTSIPGAKISLGSEAAGVATPIISTDSDGQFSFQVPPAGDYQLTVQGPVPSSGDVQAWLDTMVLQGIDLGADLVGQTISLPAFIPYSIAVVDEAGSPQVGAGVRFSSGHSSCSFAPGEGLSASFPSTFVASLEEFPRTLVTDSLGFATANFYPCSISGDQPLAVDVTPPPSSAGSLLVSTHAAAVPLPGGSEATTPPTVILHPRPLPVTLSGSVTEHDGITGVGGVRLTLNGSGSFTATTGSDGSFALIVQPGTYTLLVDGRGTSYPFRYQIDGVDLSSSLFSQNLSFPVDQTYRLHVVDGAGIPVVGATVTQSGLTSSQGPGDPSCWLTKPLTTTFFTKRISTGTGAAVISGTSDAEGYVALVIPASCTESTDGTFSLDHHVHVLPPTGSILSPAAIDLPSDGGSHTITLHSGSELSGQIVDSRGRGDGAQQLLAMGEAGTFSILVSADGHFDSWLPAGEYSLSLPNSPGGPGTYNTPLFMDYRDAQNAWSNSIGTIDGVDLRAGGIVDQTITLPPVAAQTIWPNDSAGNRLWPYQVHVAFALTCQIPAVGSTFGTPEAGPQVSYSNYTNNTLAFYDCANRAASSRIDVTAMPVLSLALQYKATSATFSAIFTGNETADLPLTPQPPHREFSYCSDRLSGGRLVSTTNGEGFDPVSSGPTCTVFSVPSDTYRLVLGATASSVLDLTQGDISDLHFPQPEISVKVTVAYTNGEPAAGVSLNLGNYVCSGMLVTSIGGFPFDFRPDMQSSLSDSAGVASLTVPICSIISPSTLTVAPLSGSNLGGEVLDYVVPFNSAQTIHIVLSSFEATVIDASGSALPAQTLSIVDGSGAVVSSNTSGSDGQVALSADPGTYTLDVAGSIGDPTDYSVAIPGVDLTAHRKVPLALPTHLIPITVVDSAGHPISGATISLACSPTTFPLLGGTASGIECGTETTSTSGAATLEVLPSTALAVTVTGPSGSSVLPVQLVLSTASSSPVTVTLRQAPAITSASSSTFTVGTPKSFSITTTGSPSASITESGTLPAGLSFHDNANGTATISGTPSASGSATVSITAANGVGTNATQSLTISVNQAPLTISTSSLPAGSLYSKSHKVLYSATLAAFSGNGAYGWRLAADSSLPPGLKLSKLGVISGKATSTGTYSFTVQVTDTKTKTKPPVQQTATRLFSITIN